ncbi:Uncharacterized protein APZ42_003218 [Daphnia magna]|uniref:Uncharacterized protein n=1 Tax=Daphnia magna TaxID=35525 RepID=A0A164HQ96_9CRUS|nr:Uncharacterized protein APZ42_003218 [Daphnia magna]
MYSNFVPVGKGSWISYWLWTDTCVFIDEPLTMRYAIVSFLVIIPFSSSFVIIGGPIRIEPHAYDML